MDRDEEFTASDVILLTNVVFMGAAPPNPPASGDLNRDGVLDSTDIVLLMNLVFLGIPPPVATFPPEVVGRLSP